MIQCVAIQRAGSEQALQASIKNGEVTLAVNKGVRYYFFPELTKGKLEKLRNEQEMSRSKGMSTGNYSTPVSK